MRSQSGGWADGEAEERPVEGRRPWRRAVVARRAASKRLFVWPSPQWKSLFVWPSRQYEKPLRMALSNQTFSNFELQRKGREPFFFRPAGARDRVCHPPACPPTPQQRAKRSYHAMFSAARPDLRVARRLRLKGCVVASLPTPRLHAWLGLGPDYRAPPRPCNRGFIEGKTDGSADCLASL